MRTFGIIRSSTLWAAVSLALICLLGARSAWATFPGNNGKIVFTANPTGSWQIYTINPDGTDMVQVTHLAATTVELWYPGFSPDGQKIVFDYGPESTGFDIYLINADGTGLTQLTHNHVSAFPRWSPDGTRIIYVQIAALTQQPVIMTMRASDGSDKKRLTSEFQLFNVAPVYAPDGENIFFASSIGGLVSAAWVMNADGLHQRRLTAAPLEASGPDISPDGRQLVISNHENTSLPSSLFVMDIDGKHLKQLTHAGNHQDLFPSYSPDGTKIVFDSDRLSSNQSRDLFTMHTDGSHIKRIATGLTKGGCPDGNCVTPSWGAKP
jgi:Tol biopolymer transport system component